MSVLQQPNNPTSISRALVFSSSFSLRSPIRPAMLISHPRIFYASDIVCAWCQSYGGSTRFVSIPCLVVCLALRMHALPDPARYQHRWTYINFQVTNSRITCMRIPACSTATLNYPNLPGDGLSLVSSGVWRASRMAQPFHGILPALRIEHVPTQILPAGGLAA